jgi:LysR family transcriptional regulator, nitrogen assimilation regulatory protein
MDLRQLRYFVEVVKLKSITRASERLNVAQPALGLQIRKLEEELGAQLFSRHSRGVEITEAGEILYREATELLARAKQAADSVRNASGEPRGRVVVGTTPSVNAMLAGKLVRRCAKDFPLVSLVLLEDLSQNLIDQLHMEQLEISFAHFIGSGAGLHLEELGYEELFFVCPLSLEIKGDSILLTDIAELRLILPSAKHALRQMVEEKAASVGVELNVPVEVHSSTTMLELVEQGVGCTILPHGLIKDYVERGVVRAHRFSQPVMIRTVNLVTLTARPLNRAEIAVVETIRSVVDEEIAAGHLNWVRPKR